MKIAVASGKGGTGKTTIATNLAFTLAETGQSVTYIDCDVEEPNGHLFLKPNLSGKCEVGIPVPVIDESRCVACGECVRFCRYNALVRLGKAVIVFHELCHGCGGCLLVCRQKAISESSKKIGIVEKGCAGKAGFVHGRLDIGEAVSPPLIRAVLRHAPNDGIALIDAPPGTSCPVVNSIRSADFAALVTEPTPFGLNDLGLMLELVRELGIPCGVIINRAENNDTDAYDYCKSKQVELITEIPYDRRIAEAYSRGVMTVTAMPETGRFFLKIMEWIRARG